MQAISELIQKVVQDLFSEQVDIELTRTDEQFGDFATNVALRLSKKLGQDSSLKLRTPGNPREIAQQIAKNITSDMIEKTEVAGPGFINITLSEKALVQLAEAAPVKQRSDTVVIETNNPNPFKAMHIGHGFNAILGDTIANLIEADGASVYRVSYHGDVGLHVGKSMYSILKFVDGDPDKLSEVPENEHNTFMSKMYAEGSRAYKEDEAAKKEIEELARQSFTREDPVYAAVYDTCFKWSFEGIDRIVKLIGNQPIQKRFLESDADVRGVPIVKKHTPAVFQHSDGAYVFPGSQYGSFDNVFVASNGQGLYGARDLGLMALKYEQYHPEKSYIITGGEQEAYFRGVIAAAGLVWEDQKDVTKNIPTGLVKLTTGKMSSRDGDVVEVEWLFEKFREAIKARGGEPLDELIAGAMRYQFLKVKVGGDVVFDIEEAVSLSGNTGSYLQYAYARAKSILEKSSVLSPQSVVSELEPAERTLLRKIGEYSEVVERATSELMPHHLCTYLYELAQTFNRFYEHNRVIDDPRENLRIHLVSKYAQTLKNGLNLLGIHAPEKM